MTPLQNPFQEIVDRLINIEASLADLKRAAIQSHPQALSAEAIEPMDVDQAAGLLRLSKQTVYDKVHAGTLPHHKRGNRIYFFKQELLEWVKSGRQKTNEDLQQEVQLRAMDTGLGTRHRKGGPKK